MPSSAMNPTDAGTDRYSPDSQSARTPPISANGMLARISTDWRTDRSVANSTRKISPSAIGTTIGKPCGGAPLVLELAAPDEAIAGRQRHLRRNRLLCVFDEADEVAAGDVGLHDGKA